MQNNNYSYLIQKLDQFIRKYYVNQLIRGSLYTVALILLTYLVFSLLEYFFFFPGGVRATLFFGFVGISLAALGYWVARPLMHYFRLGKVISHDQASRIIGSHFQNVQDKLLNILQLHRQVVSAEERSLIEASINQKIEQIRPVPFTSAINLSGNRKYLKYALVPVLALVFILFSAPNILQESNERLFYSNRTFEKPAPFSFLLEEEDLTVMQFDDFPLNIDVEGEVLPDQILAVADGYSYRMQREDGNTFQYTFKKVQEDIDFYLTANGYQSKSFTLRVMPKPMIVSFDTELDYPAYTGKKDEAKRNVGDLVVPAGTKINWVFDARNTSHLGFSVRDTLLAAQRQGNDRFIYSQRFFRDQPYSIFVGNDQLPKADSIGYNITVIPDRYPAISVERFEDSVQNKLVYFLGEANDDYGLSRVALHYQVINEKGAPATDEYVKVPVRSAIAGNEARFNHTWSIEELNLKPGDQVKYFFVVWDNDQVNGSKHTKTPLMTLKMPTREELEAQTEQTNEAIKGDLEKSVEEARKLQEEIRNMQDKMLQKKDLNWEDKKNIEDLINKHKELQKNVQSIQNQFQQNQQRQSEYQKESQQIMEKQQRLQQLFDEMMSEEMKQMMDELQKMLDKLNQEQTMEELENMELNNEQLEKELDRMLELFKQLEFEQKMNETIDKLEELAEKQDDLSEESKKQDQESKNQDAAEQKEKSEELSKKQEELNKEFEDIEKEMSDLEKMNKELQQNLPLDEMQEQKESIEEDMEQSQQNLQQNQPKDASEKQKNASQKMQEMANQMGSMMQQGQMQQMMLDMEAIRQLLDNLIKLSFDQEGLMEEIQATNVNTPRYKSLIQDQFKIREDLKMVEDSLMALSKRVFQLSSFINKEVTEVKHNLQKGIDYLADRKKNEGTARQQYVMTGLNNLALMLDEAMQQMQQQMASMMSGSQMCQKPNSSGKGMKNMRQMQKQLGEQMEQMQEGMKQGGQDGKNGKRQMSKEFAQMAAQQAAIRKALNELNKELNKDGKGSLGNLGEISEEMEKVEEDLVNKRLNAELMERQKEIMVRLLEAEEAMREREQSPERESKTADDVTKRLPPAIEEYLKQREAEIDLYKTVPPSLKPFYRNLVEDYFKSISIND